MKKLIVLLLTFLSKSLIPIEGYGSPPPPPPPCNIPQCSSGTYCYSNTNVCTPCPPGYKYNANPNVGDCSSIFSTDWLFDLF